MEISENKIKKQLALKKYKKFILFKAIHLFATSTILKKRMKILKKQFIQKSFKKNGIITLGVILLTQMLEG